MFETNESADVEIAVEKMDERKKIAQEVRDAMEDLKHDQTKFGKFYFLKQINSLNCCKKAIRS